VTGPPIRSGYKPPPRALVVRGGVIAPNDLEKDARACLRQWGFQAVSVAVADVLDLVDLMSQVNRFVARMPTVSVSTVERLAGYELVATFRAPHFSLVVPSLDDKALRDLCLLFDIVKNPLVESAGRSPTH
jgi:hypothetical protein